MRIFLSGEVDKTVGESFRVTLKDISDKLKQLETNDYGSEVENLGIIPIIVSLTPELEAAGFFKERKLYKKKNKDADIRLRVSFEKFKNGSIEYQKLLILKNIIESIRWLNAKVKEGFDGKALEKDILGLFQIDTDMIENVNI